jgi:imidazole glycerol-phosphate synthase subunit HisH
MNPHVSLFDYGVGNLHSIKKALERAGAQVQITQDGEELLRAKAIVLPGVGAFGASMKPLEDIRQQLRDRLQSGTPCLAVCIGMQLLFETSQESPGIPGIGLLKGHVQALPPQVGKIPHLGWNTLEATPPSPATKQEQDLLPSHGTYAYFVHSYYVVPTDTPVLATTTYGPPSKAVKIPAVITHKNTLATQFHPEKSSTPGLRLIQRWVSRLRQETEATAETTPTPQEPTPPDQDPKGPEGKH